MHALDDATEHDILSVKVGKGCSRGNVELRLIRMFKSIALAHAKKADLSMLDLEGFIVEFGTSLSALQLIVLGSDLAHLNEHSLDDAVDFRAGVTDCVVLPALSRRAQMQKVIASQRSDSMEKFDNDLRIRAVDVEVDLGELRVRAVNTFPVNISLLLFVIILGGIVEEGVIVQRISSEFLAAADILVAVGEDERA